MAAFSTFVCISFFHNLPYKLEIFHEGFIPITFTDLFLLFVIYLSNSLIGVSCNYVMVINHPSVHNDVPEFR